MNIFCILPATKNPSASNKSGKRRCSHNFTAHRASSTSFDGTTTTLAITRPFSVVSFLLRTHSLSVARPLRSMSIGSHDCKVPSHKRPIHFVYCLFIIRTNVPHGVLIALLCARTRRICAACMCVCVRSQWIGCAISERMSARVCVHGNFVVSFRQAVYTEFQFKIKFRSKQHSSMCRKSRKVKNQMESTSFQNFENYYLQRSKVFFNFYYFKSALRWSVS